MEEKWVTKKTFAVISGYDRKTVELWIRNGKIQPEFVRVFSSVVWVNTKALEHIKIKEPTIKKDSKTTLKAPKGTVEYDGFVLTPEQMIRLNEVRDKNGYTACHWSPENQYSLAWIGNV